MLYNNSANKAVEKWNNSNNHTNNTIIPFCSKKESLNEKKIVLKPFVKWVGGKSQILENLESIIRRTDKTKIHKYAEPFVGGGALLFSVLSQKIFNQIYISDINPELINSYQVIKNDVENLIAELSTLKKTYLESNEIEKKFLYYKSREDFNKISLNDKNATHKAALFIFLNKTCFNGLYRVNKYGLFNVPMGAYKNPKIFDALNLRNISSALQTVEIVNGDFTLSDSFIDSETFVYFDPPYRPISSTATFTSYNTVCFDDEEQRRLAKFFRHVDQKGATALLSNSDPKNTDKTDDFFDLLYGDYNILHIDATRMINSKSDKRGKIKELLISNR